MFWFSVLMFAAGFPTFNSVRLTATSKTSYSHTMSVNSVCVIQAKRDKQANKMADPTGNGPICM